MNESMIGFANGKTLTEHQARQLSPLQLAYIGDGVYDLFARTHLLKQADLPAREWHKRAISLVCASAQAQAMAKIVPTLSPDEADVARRGRNAQPSSAPRNQSHNDYGHATSLEALIGWLYISGQTKRLSEIMHLALSGEQED